MENQISINKELNSLRNEIAGLRNDLGRLVEMMGKQNSSNGLLQPAAESRDEKEIMDSRIFNLLLSYQVPVHLKGFTYLKEAIKMHVANQGSIPATKVLYPTIAKKFNDTSSRVERAMRHAIERSWSKPDAFKTVYFKGYTESKPTNSEFIAIIAELLLMEKQKESA